MITFRSDAVARISARTYRNDVGIVCLGGVESRRIAFNSEHFLTAKLFPLLTPVSRPFFPSWVSLKSKWRIIFSDLVIFPPTQRTTRTLTGSLPRYSASSSQHVCITLLPCDNGQALHSSDLIQHQMRRTLHRISSPVEISKLAGYLIRKQKSRNLRRLTMLQN